MKIPALILDTLREIYARKVVLAIVIIEVVTLVITGLVIFGDTMQGIYRDGGATPQTSMFGSDADTATARLHAEEAELLGTDSLDTALAPTPDESSVFSDDSTAQAQSHASLRNNTREMVRGQLGGFSIPLVLAALFLGIFATAGIVPSMMEKGTIDLLLSKPVSRTALLFGRTAGGVLAYAANVVFFAVALCILYGIASGVYHWGFVWWFSAGTIFSFLVLYSGIVALNVITESWVLPMSLAYVHMTILSGLLTNREAILFEAIDNRFVQALITGLYWLLPQVNDLQTATPTAIYSGAIVDWLPFLHGLGFMALMTLLAVWRFRAKDF